MNAQPSYVRFSTHRKPEFRIKTTIEKSTNGFVVVKAPMTEEARPHVLRILDNADILRSVQEVFAVPEGRMVGNSFISPFVEGMPYDRLVAGAIAKGDFSAADRYLDDYRTIVRSLPIIRHDPSTNVVFSEMFPERLGETECLAIGVLDLIMENLIQTRNGSICCIDNEWLINAPIPVDFLLYRAAAVFCHRFSSRLPAEYSLHNILARWGIKGDVALFEAWERHFSLYVHDSDLEAAITRYQVPMSPYGAWNAYTPGIIVGKLYYSTEGQYDESHMVEYALPAWRNLTATFNLSGVGKVRYLRWDPCDAFFCKIRLDTCRLHAFGNDGHLNEYSATGSNSVEWNGSRLFPTDDPQVYFRLNEPACLDKIVITAEIDLIPYGEIAQALATPAARTIGNLQLSCEEYKKDISRMGNEIVEMRATYTRSLRCLEDLEKRNHELLVCLETMRMSLSWKVTRPFRWGARMVRRFFGQRIIENGGKG